MELRNNGIINEMKKRFHDAKNFIKELGKNFDNIKTNLFEEKEKESFNELDEKFNEKFKKFNGIDRFCIPIIGLISSGKSTFLNYLLNIDCLESKYDITTKCIVIIRHNKSLKSPELFSVKFQERDKGSYNFIKNEKLYPLDSTQIKTELEKKEDLKRIISGRNNLISSASDCPDPEDFFILLEANIPLFSGENQEYSQYYEFMDLPGLDEGQNDSQDFRHSKFFKDNILPKITANAQFSLFLFDAERYLKKSDVFMDYIQKYFKHTANNSFYILNKIDLLDDYEKEVNIFKEEILKKKLNLNLEKCYINYISALQLEFESIKGKGFNYFLRHCEKKATPKLIKESKNNFNIYLKKQLEKNYKTEYKKEKIPEISDVKKKEINTFLESFNSDVKLKGFKSILKLEYYLNFEVFYNNNSNEEKKIELETYKILYNEFSKAFYNSMNDFINIKSNSEINEKMKNFSTKIWNENEEKDNVYDKINTNNYLNSDNNINVNINLIKRLEPIVDQFVDLEPENELIKDIKNDFEFLKHYIYKDRKIRVPIFGGYSTGKSSLLNSLIGFGDILPTGSGICTKRGIIIRNNPKGNYILYNSKFIRKGDYYYFEEGNIEIETEKKQVDKLKEKIIELNNVDISKVEDSFLILSIPLECFKNMKLSSDIINRIELIDFPGIDNGNDFFEKDIMNPLLKLSDTFIFVNPCNLIGTESNINNIQNIICKIENRKVKFDYNSCLFVLNQCDKEPNLNVNECQKQIIKILFQDRNKSNIIFDFFQNINFKNEINVVKFSPKLFLKYLDLLKEIDDFNLFIEINLLKPIIEESIELDEPIDDIIESLKVEMEAHLNSNFKIDDINYKCENSKNNDNNLKILSEICKANGATDKDLTDKKIILEDIINNYNIEINNKNLSNDYLSSNMEEFLKIIEKKFNISYKMVEKQIKEKIICELDNIYRTFKLIDFILINKKTKKTREAKDMESEKIKIIDEKYDFFFKLCLNQINFFFVNILNDFCNFNDEINKENANNSNLKKSAKQLNDKYITGLEKLKKFLNEKINSFEKEMTNLIINSKKEFFLEYEQNPEIEGLFTIGLKAAGFFLVSIPAVIIGAIGTIFMIIGGIGKKIYDAFESKKSVINKIKKLEDTMKDQWKSLIYNLQFETLKIKEVAIKKIKLIYNSENIENIKKNKEIFDSLFEEFKKINQDIKKTN